MIYSEDDFIPISALQHFIFCPRQCALIHIEGIWDENRLTAEGRILHDKAHESRSEVGSGMRIARSLRLHSFRLGLTGQADIVEFHRVQQTDGGGVSLPATDGRWLPFPVEYKRGRPKPDHSDIVQLCAQAICLEEMLGAQMSKGAIYYGQPRRRQEVIFSENLRKETEERAMQLHLFVARRETPRARYEKKCKSCSLFEICMPKVTGIDNNLEKYLSFNIDSDAEEVV